MAVLVAGGTLAAPAKLDGLNHHHHHHDHSHHHHPNDPLAALATSFSGYNYDPPAVPSGLYEVPAGPTNQIEVTTEHTTTTTTTTLPPPPQSYLPPRDEEQAAANVVDVIVVS